MALSKLKMALSKPKMALSKPKRKGFCEWLKDTIDSEEVRGLLWLNKEKTEVRMPWACLDKPRFVMDDAKLFKLYAIHTKKYRDFDARSGRRPKSNRFVAAWRVQSRTGDFDLSRRNHQKVCAESSEKTHTKVMVLCFSSFIVTTLNYN